MSSVNGFFAHKRPPPEKPLWRREPHWDGRLGIPRLWTDEIWTRPTKGGLTAGLQGAAFVEKANAARDAVRKANRNA
jgi:hypothetical protein